MSLSMSLRFFQPFQFEFVNQGLWISGRSRHPGVAVFDAQLDGWCLQCPTAYPATFFRGLKQMEAAVPVPAGSADSVNSRPWRGYGHRPAV